MKLFGRKGRTAQGAKENGATPSTAVITTAPQSASTSAPAKAHESAGAPSDPKPPATPPPAQPSRVRVHLRSSNGRPLAGLLIRASNAQLRHEQELGACITGAGGTCEIAYALAEGVRADLIARAYDGGGQAIATSSLYCKADPDIAVDLVAERSYRGPSDWDTDTAAVRPHLDGADPGDLADNDQRQDISLLACKTGIDKSRLSALAAAHRLAKDTSLDAEVLYGLFREELPAELPALFLQSPDLQRHALTGALEKNIVGLGVEKLIEPALARLKELRVKHALAVSTQEGKAPLGALLSTVLPSARLQEAFVAAQLDHKDSPHDFWTSLAGKPELRPHAEKLANAIELAQLTDGHLPLVAELQRLQGTGEIKTLADLASLDVDGWLAILGRPTPIAVRSNSERRSGTAIGVPPGVSGESDNAKAHAYAQILSNRLEDAHPTAAVAGRIGKLTMPGKEHVAPFLAANPAFNVRWARFDSYIRHNPNALAGIKDHQATRGSVKAFQRVYRLSGRLEHASALLNAGIHSAHRIASMGRNTFVRKHGAALGGPEAARKLHARAQEVQATALNLAVEYGFGSLRVPMHVVPEDAGAHRAYRRARETGDARQGETGARTPPLDWRVPGESGRQAIEDAAADWRSLFGSLELCACEHCTSVLSPAAYFVDLLQFLNNRAEKSGRSPKDVLFGRRPDLGEIEISCENSNTLLPYVDLVNELLEDAVVRVQSFALVAPPGVDFDAELDRREVSPALRQALLPPATSAARITSHGETVFGTPHHEVWQIEDERYSYEINKAAGTGQLSFMPRIPASKRQTTGSAAELAALPQHINDAAYIRLRGSVYPWQLPFDRPWEEARAYLAHLGVARHETMAVFSAGTRAVARELLGLTQIEADIIVGAAHADDPWTLWGLNRERLGADNAIPDPDRAADPPWITTGSWVEALTRVDVFLQQSGLTYKQLLELLGTFYVNPRPDDADQPRPIKIQGPADQLDTCNTRLLTLTGLDRGALWRMVRFVRLWRRLGWSMRDLDRAYTAFAAVPRTPEPSAFLIHLAEILRLSAMLGLPAPRIAGWWGNIDTAAYIDHDAPGQPAAASLYEQLFRNRAVNNPADEAFVDVTRLQEQFGATYDPLRGGLDEHRPTLCAALGLGDTDLTLLLRSRDVAMRGEEDLTLANLSVLHRHASLAKALRTPISDYLCALRLGLPDDPFASATTTRLFVEEVGRVRESGLSFAEVAYLLRHEFTSETARTSHEEVIEALLEEIRSGLEALAADNTLRDDPTDPAGLTIDSDGSLTRRKLALLGWDSATVEQAVATLAGTVVYEAEFPTFPEGMVLPNAANVAEAERDPEAYRGDVVHDNASGRLLFRGPMADARKTRLETAAPTNAAWLAAVRMLYEAPRAFLARHMRRFTVPTRLVRTAEFTRLDELLAAPGFTFPAAVQHKLAYDPTAHTLAFAGVMLAQERELLRDASENAEYRRAIEALYADGGLAPVPDDTFLTTEGEAPDSAALFQEWKTPAERFAFVLKKLLPHLYRVQGEQLVVDSVAAGLALEPSTAGKLLRTWLESPIVLDARRPCLAEFFVEGSFARGADGTLRIARADDLRGTLIRLEKSALVARRLSHRYLKLLFAHHATGGWLDLNELVVEPRRAETGAGAAQFKLWLELYELLRITRAFPSGEEALDDLFTKAKAIQDAAGVAKNTSKEAWFDAACRWSGWSATDLELLVGRRSDHTSHGVLGATFGAGFPSAQLLGGLLDCFAMQRRLGLSAQDCLALASPDVPAEAARNIRQAVRAKYQVSEWLTVTRPLMDIIREKSRSALVAYLVAHGPRLPTLAKVRDANDLYAHFLIDVEMSPCMLTSRIKQGIASVQLFTQRCLMNLEPSVQADEDHDEGWLQWQWMKAYRVWEANRKVFLYPENWIEPELRDDKSAIFRAVESELLQSDLGKESAEAAITHYLEKLDRIARLEVVGTYLQTKLGHDDVLHVFGRTYAQPRAYFYRTRVGSGRLSKWTPWEEVPLDIEGDHLLPVVYSGHLFLFWPIFIQKPVRTSDSTVVGWEIKVAWSQKSSTGWTSKVIANSSLDLSWLVQAAETTGRPLDTDLARFFFKLNVVTGGELRIMSYYGRDEYDQVLWPIYAAPELGAHYLSFSFSGPHAEISLSRDSRLIDTRLRGTIHAGPYLQEAEGDERLYLPRPGVTPALERSPGIFRLLAQSDVTGLVRRGGHILGLYPFFYIDARRTFLVCWEVFSSSELFGETASCAFHGFYHPYVGMFRQELGRDGVRAFKKRTLQNEPWVHVPAQPRLAFDPDYGPRSPVVIGDRDYYPKDDVDFEFSGSYSLYNWELFFHAPLLIADRLSKNQRYEEAQGWLHCIFDPTDTSGHPSPKRYWITRPFFEREIEGYAREDISYILRLLAADAAGIRLPAREQVQDLQRFKQAVAEWRDDPFKPHLVARMRTTAYQKAVVMKYIDILIAWGDSLFRRDTIEAINEAIQLYVLAADILGPRPQEVPPRARTAVHTYNNLEPALRGESHFSVPAVEIEDFTPPTAPGSATPASVEAGIVSLPGMMLYFCVPKNDKLLGYWDTVADRLFKIRHCMNIEGAVRQLPLWEPPIDPALLVRAAAAGVDVSEVLADLGPATLPHYRFHVLAQKATELAAEVKMLGGALLSALEKRDAEHLAMLRAQHETALLEEVERVREQQLEEGKASREALAASRDVAVHRWNHYQRLLGVTEPAEPAPGQRIDDISPSALVRIVEDGGLKITAHERDEGAQLKVASNHQDWAAVAEGLANVAHLFPNLTIDFLVGGKSTFGGGNLGPAASAWASVHRFFSGLATYDANLAGRHGQFALRAHEWALQANQAARDIMQIDKQIAAADIRIAIAEAELANHRKQINNARQIEEHLRDKYTNEQLYSWMIGQISTVHFRAHQLAFDVARSAERAFRHELGLRGSNFIQYGQWDSLKKGLLAGERLAHDLKRMEVAYLEENRREYEITKHVSLAQLDPRALVELRRTGSCEVRIPEVLFDLDYPGHYMRRIKSVSLTVPCVAGPYTGVNCTLTLMRSAVRHSAEVSGTYARQPDNDQRFTDIYGAIESIATSSGQNDSGLFEPSLRDERYLPFEGAGAIGEWRLVLPTEFKPFDYDTISDVVLHMRYTARDGGDVLRSAANRELKDILNAIMRSAGQTGLAQAFNLKHDFPTEWHRFLNPQPGTAVNQLRLPLRERFPFLFRGSSISVRTVDLFVKAEANELSLTLEETAVETTHWHDLLHASVNVAREISDAAWTLSARRSGAATEGSMLSDADGVENIWLVCWYSLE